MQLYRGALCFVVKMLLRCHEEKFYLNEKKYREIYTIVEQNRCENYV